MVFVLLALSMFGFYDLQIPASWQAKLAGASNRQEGGTFVGVGIMGCAPGAMGIIGIMGCAPGAMGIIGIMG